MTQLASACLNNNTFWRCLAGTALKQNTLNGPKVSFGGKIIHAKLNPNRKRIHFRYGLDQPGTDKPEGSHLTFKLLLMMCFCFSLKTRSSSACFTLGYLHGVMRETPSIPVYVHIAKRKGLMLKVYSYPIKYLELIKNVVCFHSWVPIFFRPATINVLKMTLQRSIALRQENEICYSRWEECKKLKKTLLLLRKRKPIHYIVFFLLFDKNPCFFEKEKKVPQSKKVVPQIKSMIH